MCYSIFFLRQYHAILFILGNEAVISFHSYFMSVSPMI